MKQDALTIDDLRRACELLENMAPPLKFLVYDRATGEAFHTDTPGADATIWVYDDKTQHTNE